MSLKSVLAEVISLVSLSKIVIQFESWAHRVDKNLSSKRVHLLSTKWISALIRLCKGGLTILIELRLI